MNLIQFFDSIGVTIIHLVLAYIGMLLHMLVKLAELNEQKDFNLISYAKKNIYTVIASIIMIPVLLILSSDTSLKDVLPINNVTAVLAGWQTQSVFRSLMSFYSGKIKKPVLIENHINHIQNDNNSDNAIDNAINNDSNEHNVNVKPDEIG
jgi:hypothetical protein